MTSEIQYIYLLNKLLEDGEERETRNGKTLSIFGYRMDFDLQEGFPLLTTKKMFFKGIMTELAWFLRGSTDVTELHKYNNRIWDLNTQDRDYDAGPVYGFSMATFWCRLCGLQDRLYGKRRRSNRSVDKDIQENPTKQTYGPECVEPCCPTPDVPATMPRHVSVLCGRRAAALSKCTNGRRMSFRSAI